MLANWYCNCPAPSTFDRSTPHARWRMVEGLRKRLRPKRVGLLFAAATVWFLAPGPGRIIDGGLGNVYSGVRVGMPQDQIVTLIRESGKPGIEYYYVSWATIDGRHYEGYGLDWLEELPPADQVAWAKLEIDGEDSNLRELVIELGPGGVVSRVRFQSECSLETAWHAISLRSFR